MNDFLDKLLNQFKIVKGDSDQIDEELRQLTQYFESNKTGYTALTTQANVFYEIFGNAVAITSPTIEDLMVYLEKVPKRMIRAFLIINNAGGIR